MRRIASLVVIALCSTGCYSYARTELSSVPNGSQVRARISTDQAARIEPLLGRTDLRVLDAVLLQSTGDTVLLEVPAASRTITGGGIQVLHQRVTVSRAGILDLELKKLNRGRTALITVGGGTLLIVAAIDALNIGPGRESPPGGGDGPDFRIPLIFRLQR
jgi:hypothetical protein